MDFLNDQSGTVIMFTVMYGLVKIVELLVKKLTKEQSVLMTDERRWLESLYDTHSQKDQDGMPLWYVPRTMTDSQTKLQEMLVTLTASQEKICYVLESVAKQLEHIECTHRKVNK